MCENLVQIGWGFQELSSGKTKWHADKNADENADANADENADEDKNV